MTTDQTLPLIIRLFGPFQLLRGGRSLPPPRSRKGHELLALLTLRHGQEVSRTWLAYTLWPDSPHEAALASLGQSLHNLRKVLGEEASRIGTPSSRSLCLDVTDADVDVIAFDRAIAHGSPEALQEAITHYRGPFLEGCLEPWADAERAYREQAYLQALDRLATRARYDGALDVTIGYLKRILSTDPFHLAANRQLMQMYTNAEDYATALQIFYDLRQRLHEEHKILPDDETTALYQRIVALARQRSESSSQTAGPLSQALAPVIGLPEPLTDLIGRDQEVSEIAADLLSVRLITLSGIGGVGKTRLAIQVARESASHFMHGVGFVRLEALTDAAHLSQQIATVLKVPAERGRSWEEALQDYLSSRQLLLVLDNCEHLRDSCARLVGKLLGECPALRILATSRERLGLTGESIRHVSSLGLPASAETYDLEELRCYPSVHLFLERASARCRGFALTAANAVGIVDICRRLDGIPLAIELATALLDTLTVGDIATRLRSHIHLLSSDDITAPTRHKTLEETFDWSYDLLTRSEQKLLRFTSVFAEGWTLEAAEALPLTAEIETWEIVRLLSRLVAKSLVLTEEYFGSLRYRLLETVRVYAKDRLERSMDEQPVRCAHSRFYVAFAETAEGKLQGSDQIVWLEKIEREHDNLRAALEWSLLSKAPEDALCITTALWRFFYGHGFHREGREWIERALSINDAISEPLRLKSLKAVGNFAFAEGDYSLARLRFGEASLLAQKLGEVRTQASSLASLANVDIAEQKYVDARANYEQALPLFEQCDLHAYALTIANLAIVEGGQGDYLTARDLHLRALAVFKAHGTPSDIGLELANLTYVYFHLDEMTLAQKCLEEAFEISSRLNHQRLMAHCLVLCCSLAIRKGLLDWAAVIIGMEAALRKRSNVPLPPAADRDYQRDLTFVLTGLGASSFETHRKKGGKMESNEVVAFVLEFFDHLRSLLQCDTLHTN